jgi:hypothetical protein
MTAMSKGRFRDLFKSRRDRRRASRRNTVVSSPGPESLEVRTLLSFAPAVIFPVGVHPRAVTVADFNNDGTPDLAVVNQGSFSTSTTPRSLSVLLGNGDGSFRPAVTTDVPNSFPSLAVGDFNSDGRADVALPTAGNGANPALEVLLGNGDGSFQPNHRILSLGQAALSVTAGDFDRNGTLDLVTANGSSGTLSLLLGNGDGTFQPRTDLTVGAAPRAVAVGDFNGDGRLDVVAAQQLTDTVSVLLGHGNGTFAPPLVFAASGADFTPDSMVVADVNGDGKLDLAIKSLSFLESDAFRVGVLLGNGNGTFQAPLLGAAQPDGSGDLALGDFNNDGRIDAAVADELGDSSGNLSVFAGNGDGTFQSLIRLDLLTGGNGPKGVAAADLNGDGLVDLVAANFAGIGDTPSTVGVLLNTSRTATAKTSTTLATSTATAVFGQRVTLTALVTSAAGVPTGTVTFRDGTTVLGTAQVNAAGQATLAVSLGVGNHELISSFVGTGNFTDSTGLADLTVNRAATTVALKSSVNPAATGQAVTFTATVAVVAPGAGTPTGTVTFEDGSVILGTVAVGAGGTATFTTSFAAAGGHVIAAVYNGDPHFVDSAQRLTEQVNAGVTATFSAEQGVLTVTGDAQNNTIVVSRDAAGTILVNNGAVIVQGGTSTVANTRLIQVSGLGGNDTISLNEVNGALPNARINGGAGNDTLTGGAGNDLLIGGAGNDTYRFDTDNALGSDIIDESGGGVDTLDFSATTNRAVSVNLGNKAAQVVNAGLTLTLLDDNSIENATGGALNDRLTGNGLNNSLVGGAGNDTIEGVGGNDTLIGGAGNDTLDGGAGTDTLDGGAGTDVGINGEVLINLP